MIHHVFANRSNTGDWLAARGIQQLLLPSPVTEHRCDRPFVDETLEALSKTGREDLVVIGGGGLFMNYFEPFWAGLASLDPPVRYCLWGVGACDMKREDSRMDSALLEQVIATAALCVVRDELTRSLVPGVVLPDPVPCPTTVALAGRRRRGTGILHVDNYDNVGPEGYELMRGFLSVAAADRGEVLRQTNNRIDSGRLDQLEDNIGRYEASRVVVTSALHGCIIGLALGCRVLAVSGDRKIESFMAAASLADWVLDVGELDRLEERFSALEAQPAATGFVAEAVARNGEVAGLVRHLAAAR